MLRVLNQGSSAFRALHRRSATSPLSVWGASRNFNFLSGETEEDSSSDGDSIGSSAIVVPAKVPFGESAPRVPHTLALPLVSRPLFPGLITSLTLTDEATITSLQKLRDSQAKHVYISCFLRKKDPSGVSEGGVVLAKPEVITDPADIYSVGTFAEIQRLTRGVPNPKPSHPSDLVDEEYEESHSAVTLTLLAHRRVDLMSVDHVGPPIDVTVKHWNRMEYTGSDDTIRALSNEIISTIREVAQMNALFRESLNLFPMRFDANDPFRLADFAASISALGSPQDLQAVLEERDPEMRLHKALVLLSREREVSKLQKEINAKVEEKMSETQRKYFLNEQLKSIKKELGMERDDKDALIEKYRKKMAEYSEVPAEAMDIIEAELEKFSTLERNSPEYTTTRSYLDWLTGVPWGVATPENYDIREARKILNRDHYGLEDVKDAILEFIAIGKLKGSVQGKIVCLAGPPGTGKVRLGVPLL
jgi:Lon-like ATP-dependent protease